MIIHLPCGVSQWLETRAKVSRAVPLIFPVHIKEPSVESNVSTEAVQIFVTNDCRQDSSNTDMKELYSLGNQLHPCGSLNSFTNFTSFARGCKYYTQK
jgi:hypothetical protein